MNEILSFMEGSKKVLMVIVGAAIPFSIGINGIPFGAEKLAKATISCFLAFPPWMSNLELVFFYSGIFGLLSAWACHSFWDFKMKCSMDTPFNWDKASKRLQYKYVFSIINYSGSILTNWVILYLWSKRAKAEIEALMEKHISGPNNYDPNLYWGLNEQKSAIGWMLFAAIIAVPYITCLIGFYTAEPTFRSRNN